MKKKAIAWVTALLMTLCMCPAVSLAEGYTISQSGAYTMSALGYASGDRITIAAGLTVTLIGDSTVTYTDFAISCEAGVTLTLSNVNIDDTANDFVCPLTFTGSGSTLILADGTVNTLKGGSCCAGVGVGGGAELTITGGGTLNAAGQGKDLENHWHTAAGIGGAGDHTYPDCHFGSGLITIAGGTVNATGGYYGAGIGGADGGDGHVRITGGTVTATGGNYGAGIGGGYFGNGIVAITGGTVTATGVRAAGIGGGVSGHGTVTIEGGTVNAQAGIGSAGIGGGTRGGGCTVTISGGTVNATGMNQGTGIGGGTSAGGTVEISGGTVKATCPYGAAIGSGYRGTAFTVRITGGTVTAVSSADSTTYALAGIGRGNSGAAGTIAISDATVFAGGFNDSYMDIDSGTAGADGSVTISDSAAVFLRRDKITPPTTQTHTHSSYDAGTTAVYSVGMPADWTDAFGAYLRVVTLSYDANGGSGAPSSVSQLYGATASADSGSGVTNGNYSFTGWNTVSDGSGTAYAAGDAYTFAADETLYAQWDGTDVTVASGDDSYGGVSGGGEYEPGASVTVAASPNAGCYFAGWYEGDTLVSPDAAYTFTAGDDVTLTARFHAYITVTAVSGNSEYGSVSGGGDYTTDASVTLTATANAGYYFTGWYDGAALVSSQAVYTFPASESITLTAEFVSFVTVSAESGNTAYGSVTGGGAYETGTEVTLTAAANAGYYFVGWYDGGTLVSDSASYTFAAVDDVALTGQFDVVGIPADVTAAIAAYNKITLTWSPAQGAAGYRIWRSTSEGGDYKVVKTTTGTTFTNTGLSICTTYYYKIQAYTAGKVYGQYSSAPVSATTTLGGVTGIRVSSESPRSAEISWDTLTGAYMYEVWRATSDGIYTLAGTTLFRSFTDTGLTTDVTYSYKVVACRIVSGAYIYGDFSGEAAVTPAVAQVTGAKAVRSGSAKVKLSWSAVGGAEKYEIWVSDTADGVYTLLDETASRNYTDATASARCYKIRAYNRIVNEKHYGEYSAVVNP